MKDQLRIIGIIEKLYIRLKSFEITIINSLNSVMYLYPDKMFLEWSCFIKIYYFWETKCMNWMCSGLDNAFTWYWWSYIYIKCKPFYCLIVYDRFSRCVLSVSITRWIGVHFNILCSLNMVIRIGSWTLLSLTTDE